MVASADAYRLPRMDGMLSAPFPVSAAHGRRAVLRAVASRLAGIIALDARLTAEEIAYVAGLLEAMSWQPQAAHELRALLDQSN
jgi:hypothetical protein